MSGFPDHPAFSQAVFLVDCVWELFVVIGSEARGRRLDIRLALHVAHVSCTAGLVHVGTLTT